MRGVLRGAIPSCILHAALHCCLSMLMLQMMMPHRCYYVLMACIDVTMHLMACSTASTTPHCLACCMCMHRLPMCISGRERWGWALELRSEVTLKFCTYESCLISKYTVVWGPRWYHLFLNKMSYCPAGTTPLHSGMTMLSICTAYNTTQCYTNLSYNITNNSIALCCMVYSY